MRADIIKSSDEYAGFWREYHLCTLTTMRPDGSAHVVPVGVTLDADSGIARVITRKSSVKVANILAAPAGEARAAVCQVDGGRWATLEGPVTVRTDHVVVDDAVERYGERYRRTPAPDPERVVIEIAIERAMGNVGLPQSKVKTAPDVTQASA
ncbi:pyridoxamine 5'-phosphate oxidase family protein [Streptomyces sp. NPDC058548]|uniref:pyridoxamine 5'-phosphate oxidase family protein n=1 Tax=Streptomyces sp. NPDC058548 TaxID=3346545 RepID=UPI00365566BA